MLPKPAMGERPIGLTNMPYRVWNAMRRGWVIEWEDRKAGFWDTAIKGSSALQTGLERLVMDKIAYLHSLYLS